jgi:phosphate/sulfate permease
MLDVFGTIGSVVVVLLLVVLATLVIAVVALVALAVMAGSMTNWRRLWRRLTGRQARLTLKLSGSAVPERRRAELSGGTPRLRRRFLLGGD